MLARRDTSAAALREALRRDGLADEEVEAELEAAVRLGALDERRSARIRARALVLKGGWPRGAMHARLVQQGYPAGLAEEALAEVLRDEGWDVRVAAARAVVSGERPARSARRLLARGFDPALVRELFPGVEGIEEGG
jgi:SOS response regulatory protein OraA/RecX